MFMNVMGENFVAFERVGIVISIDGYPVHASLQGFFRAICFGI